MDNFGHTCIDVYNLYPFRQLHHMTRNVMHCFSVTPYYRHWQYLIGICNSLISLEVPFFGTSSDNQVTANDIRDTVSPEGHKYNNNAGFLQNSPVP